MDLPGMARKDAKSGRILPKFAWFIDMLIFTGFWTKLPSLLKFTSDSSTCQGLLVILEALSVYTLVKGREMLHYKNVVKNIISRESACNKLSTTVQMEALHISSL